MTTSKQMQTRTMKEAERELRAMVDLFFEDVLSAPTLEILDESARQRRYVTWNEMRRMREGWRRAGHDDVPSPNCSCGFYGLGAPSACVEHGRSA